MVKRYFYFTKSADKLKDPVYNFDVILYWKLE